MFSPTPQSFWMPLFNALIAFAVGFALGFAVSTIAGGQYPETAGVFIGSIFAALVWLVDHIVWLNIVKAFFTPVWLRTQEDEGGADVVDVTLPGPNDYEVHNLDRTESFYLRGVPVDQITLFRFALAVVRDGRRPVFAELTRGDERVLSEDEFTKLREWFLGKQWVRPGQMGQIEFNEYGYHILTLILENGIDSPTQIPAVAQ